MIGYQSHPKDRLIKNITGRQISYAMIDAMQRYEPLRSYAKDRFNRDMTFVRGLVLDRDEYTENRYEQTPMIVVDNVKRVMSELSDKRTWVLAIMIKVAHKGEYFDPPEEDGVVTYSGFDEVEQIADYIVEALAKCQVLQCLDFEEIEIITEPLRFLSTHTEYNGFMNFTLTTDAMNCIGKNWLTDEATNGLGGQ